MSHVDKSDAHIAHDALASLLAYPDADYRERARELSETIRSFVPEARGDLEAFCAAVEAREVWDLEEIYAHTFDNSADRALEVGWHVYGETYERGRFLVEMRQRIKAHGLPETTELPDHLSHVLRVLPRTEEGDASKLATLAVSAIAKVAAELAKIESPWLGLVDASWKLVSSHQPEEVTL